MNEHQTTDIVEQLRLLQSGAAWQCGKTATTLEDAGDEIERLRVIEHAADRAWRAYSAGLPLNHAMDLLLEALGPDVPPHLEGPV